MEIGSVAETVEVTVTAGAELQTVNATVGNTITGVALNSLPAIGGDVSTFVTLQPGVGPDGSVAGAVVDQSTFMLDGGNNTKRYGRQHAGLHAELRWRPNRWYRGW